MKFEPAIESSRRFDRHARLVAELAGGSEEEVIRKFLGERVLLTVSAAGTVDRSTRITLAAAANLIARFCPRIDLTFPRPLGDEAGKIQALLQAIDSSPSAEFRIIDRPDYDDYRAILSVGHCSVIAPSLIMVDSSGWLAMTSRSGSFPPVTRVRDDNPFGALMAAALGAAEVFKLLLDPLPGKVHSFDDSSFSAFDYSVNEYESGPTLSESVHIPLSLLAGVGAVGNAFLLSLSCLDDVEGNLIAVDQETVDDLSNLNRYAIAVEADANPENPSPKTELAVRLFRGRRLHVHPYQERLESVLENIYRREVPRPRVLLSAVDNNDARNLLQKLWPDLLLEGATDRTTSQVSKHAYEEGLACLLCIHTADRKPESKFSYVKYAASISGLSEGRILAGQASASAVVGEEDIRSAPQGLRGVLSANVGKPICSVLAELEKLSRKSDVALPIQPAVSFVSMISGILMAAELVKYSTGLKSHLETFFQMDSLFPLSSSFAQAVEKGNGCYCRVREKEIREYRERVQVDAWKTHLN